MTRCKTTILFCVLSLAAGAQVTEDKVPEYVGKYDYPEISLSLAIPSGEFANDVYTPTNQQAGYASNGFGVSLAYHVGFGKSVMGWYLSLNYLQMRHNRYNDLTSLNPPLRSQDETGTITKNGHYLFIGFFNGPAVQLNTGRIDPFIRGLFGPSYISCSRTKIQGGSGTEYTYSANGTVGLARGGEAGIVFYDNLRVGLSFLTFGTVPISIQEGSEFFNSQSYDIRQPISFWRLSLSYTWKKTR